ncbi:DNA-binding transcriptional regulator, LysR family [Saccharopolyspora kobensis]|uniref:DNA-binding transcriptional regulator, LysR family n=1 Tax=Saccharopolyspora kobensis TaxID=146035 RepID=A0A1H6DN42_9PSEU|nr:LysR family transcriptional regulator [Saccharopolyspora kobensis]SEG86740.1 DNA-binding transcriptional regulator, LysR family [Saccharopolyspora kobensis]SFF00645.1 DNA-binding transcriptional regulator, LysR family [Saccharopolyspora kobensis]
MDAQRLLVFREIVRAGSLGAAARALGWTQPAVSQHLRQLERQAGTALVLRHPRGVRLTEAGQVLARHAEALSARLRAAEEDLAELVELRAGTLRLAAFPSASATLVPATVTALRAEHPGLTVRLHEAEPPEAIRLVSTGGAELAMVFTHGSPEQDPDLVWLPLGTEQLRVVLPADSPRRAEVVELAELREERWIGGCESCTANLVEVCRSAGFDPEIHHGTDDYVVTQALVAAGLGSHCCRSSP